jgi:hypothetical protein
LGFPRWSLALLETRAQRVPLERAARTRLQEGLLFLRVAKDVEDPKSGGYGGDLKGVFDVPL